jgi:hypothetical protein
LGSETGGKSTLIEENSKPYNTNRNEDCKTAYKLVKKTAKLLIQNQLPTIII